LHEDSESADHDDVYKMKITVGPNNGLKISHCLCKEINAGIRFGLSLASNKGILVAVRILTCNGWIGSVLY